MRLGGANEGLAAALAGATAGGENARRLLHAAASLARALHATLAVLAEALVGALVGALLHGAAAALLATLDILNLTALHRDDGRESNGTSRAALNLDRLNLGNFATLNFDFSRLHRFCFYRGS